MTTTHHDPHAFGAPLTSAELNRPLGQLDAAIDEVITTGSGASTTLTAQANSGQAALVVASVADLAVGDVVYIGRAGESFESHVVDSIAVLTVTLDANLANTYPVGTAVTKSPVEIVDARGSYSSLGGRLEQLGFGLLNAKEFGAVGDGTTDDTAALQAAIDALAGAGIPGLFIPAGTYKVTAALELPDISGRALIGAGWDSTTIVQHTNNIPVFKTTVEVTHSVRFGEMTLQYNTTQTSANTGAIALAFTKATAGVGSGWFYWKVQRLIVRKAHIAIGIGGPGASGFLAVWNCSFEQVRTENISMSIIKFVSPTAIGMPINTFRNITHVVNAVAPAGPAIDLSAVEAHFDGLDIEDWTGRLLYTGGGSPVKVTGLHTERHVLNSTSAMFEVANAPLTIENGAITAEVTGGVAAKLFRIDTAGSLAVIGTLVSITLTSGTILGLEGGTGHNYDFVTSSGSNVTLPTRPSSAVATQTGGSLTLSTTEADIASATITATPVGAEIWVVTAFFDMRWTTASGGNFAAGALHLDGVGQAGSALLLGDAINGGTVGYEWRLAVAAGTAHTVKLRAGKFGAGGVAVVAAARLILDRRQA